MLTEQRNTSDCDQQRLVPDSGSLPSALQLKSLWDSRGDEDAQFFYVVLHHVHGVVGAGMKKSPDSKSVWGELLLWDRVGRARERLSDLEAFE